MFRVKHLDVSHCVKHLFLKHCKTVLKHCWNIICTTVRGDNICKTLESSDALTLWKIICKSCESCWSCKSCKSKIALQIFMQDYDLNSLDNSTDLYYRPQDHVKENTWRCHSRPKSPGPHTLSQKALGVVPLCQCLTGTLHLVKLPEGHLTHKRLFQNHPQETEKACPQQVLI